MNYIYCLIELLKKALKHKIIWAIFPFSIVAFVLSAVYFVLFCFYMLVDLLVIEMKKELKANNENVGFLAMAWKYLIAYTVYIVFQIWRIYMLIPLAILYFLINIFLFVASIGRVRENPFIFHTI
jgi:hypothetical protein